MHTLSSFRPHIHTHTHSHTITIWGPQTDGAKNGHCPPKNIIYKSLKHFVLCLICVAKTTDIMHLWQWHDLYRHYKINTAASTRARGAGIAQWLEHRTRDWKVAGSNPCWNGGRIFFSRVDFLCWLLLRYPFHPRVTAVARKKSRSFFQKCRWQVTAEHAYTLRMWILLNRASVLVTTCP